LRQLRLVREIGVTCPLCNEEQVPSLLYTGRCQSVTRGCCTRTSCSWRQRR
jgi:hypothetical protein